MNDTFYTTLQSLLNTNHFKKQSDEVYTLVRQKTQPGSTISVNGRVMQQRDQTFTIIHELYIMGDGWCANMDDSNKREFSQLKFVIKQISNNEEIILLDSVMCIYYEDIEELNNIFNKFVQS